MNLNGRLKELESTVLDTSKLKFGEAKIQLPEIEEAFVNSVIASINPNSESLTPEQTDMMDKVKHLMLFRANDILFSMFDSIFNLEHNEDISLYIKLRLLRANQSLIADVQDFKEGMLEAEVYGPEPDEPEKVEEAEVREPMQEPKGPVIEFMPPPPSLPLIDKDSQVVNKPCA